MVQTFGGTSIGDIVLTQEKNIAELRALTEEMEKNLIESSKKSTAANDRMDGKKKKGLSQKEKKRKREEEGEEVPRKRTNLI